MTLQNLKYALYLNNLILLGKIQNLQDLIKALDGSIQIAKVDELPTQDINPKCIYLLPTNPQGDNYFEEYMYVDGKWELLGNTKVDLSQYTTTEELNELLKDYQLAKDSHKHDNLETLNGLSDVDGLLNYKGEPVFPIVTDIDIQQAITDTLNQLLKKEE